MTSTLRDTLDRFPSQRVLVIGDVMLDEYLAGDCSRLSPEAPVPIVSVTSSRSVLGGAANAAHNIASLGGCAVLIGVVGDDDPGRRIVELANGAGIQFVPVRDGRPTVRKTRVLGPQQQLLRLDYESTQEVSAATEAESLRLALHHLGDSRAVVISDYAKGLVTHGLCHAVIEAARAAHVPVIIDPRPQHADSYVGCDYLTPNWKESLGLVGYPEVPPTPEAIEEIGRRLAGRFGAHVLMTLGAKGMRFFGRDGGSLFEEASLAKEVFDVSGAGDTVVAAFALALAAGCDHRAAVALANRAAGVVVSKLGTATVHPADLLEEPEAAHPVVSRESLAQLAVTLRASGKRIVTLNGSFDLLHAGHLHILREARRQGDVLIVGLNSDRSVRANKGPDRPLIGEGDRARMLLALRDVDYVHIFDETVPMPFLEQVRPDVHVNGSEYGTQCIEASSVRAFGGRLHLVDRIPGLATSELIARIQESKPARTL
jgi:D-beta-D-heptose 7-phosphate kinase/D-beta-D-heptose 1-phosphate adenosyltransferase